VVVSEWRRVRDERQQRFWLLVMAGASFSQACEAVGVDRRQGYRWRRASGGRPPSAPRVGSARYLSLEERLQIADLDLAGASMRAIAARLGRAASTISRELRRNRPVLAPAAGRARRARYAPYAAHKRAGLRARRPKPFKLDDARLALAVQDKLCLKWSPARSVRTWPASMATRRRCG
jgi:IS30 family transposase